MNGSELEDDDDDEGKEVDCSGSWKHIRGNPDKLYGTAFIFTEILFRGKNDPRYLGAYSSLDKNRAQEIANVFGIEDDLDEQEESIEERKELMNADLEELGIPGSFEVPYTILVGLKAIKIYQDSPEDVISLGPTLHGFLAEPKLEGGVNVYYDTYNTQKIRNAIKPTIKIDEVVKDRLYGLVMGYIIAREENDRTSAAACIEAIDRFVDGKPCKRHTTGLLKLLRGPGMSKANLIDAQINLMESVNAGDLTRASTQQRILKKAGVYRPY